MFGRKYVSCSFQEVVNDDPAYAYGAYHGRFQCGPKFRTNLERFRAFVARERPELTDPDWEITWAYRDPVDRHDEMSCGKYQGQTFEDVFVNHRQYRTLCVKLYRRGMDYVQGRSFLDPEVHPVIARFGRYCEQELAKQTADSGPKPHHKRKADAETSKSNKSVRRARVYTT